MGRRKASADWLPKNFFHEILSVNQRLDAFTGVPIFFFLIFSRKKKGTPVTASDG